MSPLCGGDEFGLGDIGLQLSRASPSQSRRRKKHRKTDGNRVKRSKAKADKEARKRSFIDQPSPCLGKRARRRWASEEPSPQDLDLLEPQDLDPEDLDICLPQPFAEHEQRCRASLLLSRAQLDLSSDDDADVTSEGTQQDRREHFEELDDLESVTGSEDGDEPEFPRDKDTPKKVLPTRAAADPLAEIDLKRSLADWNDVVEQFDSLRQRERESAELARSESEELDQRENLLETHYQQLESANTSMSTAFTVLVGSAGELGGALSRMKMALSNAIKCAQSAKQSLVETAKFIDVIHTPSVRDRADAQRRKMATIEEQISEIKSWEPMLEAHDRGPRAT